MPAVVTWINPAGGLWHVGSNWDSGAVPEAADDVVIPDLPGNRAITHSQNRDVIRTLTSEEAVILSGGSLELADGSVINSSLVLSSGATLTGAGDLTVNGRFTWTGGTMDGAGTTTAFGGIVFSGGGVTLGRTLRSTGLAAFRGPSSSLTIATAGVFSNEPGAVFDMTNNQGVSGAGTFHNQATATVRRSVSPDAVTFQPRLNNDGVVEVASGLLSLNGGGNHTGSFTGSAGAVLQFNGGTHTLAAGSSVSMSEVVFRSGTVTVSGTYTVSQATTFSGAAVTFTGTADLRSAGDVLTVSAGSLNCNSGEALAARILNLNGGTLSGASNIALDFAFWSGGTLSGSGTTTVGSVVFNGGAATLGRTLNVSRAAFMTSQNASLTLSLGAVFNNRPFAEFQLNNSQGLFGQGVFNNQAGSVFVRAGDSGTAGVRSIFNNDGEVRVETGTLNFSNGGNHGGRFLGLSGTTLQFGGGAHEFQPASAVDAAHVVFSAGSASVSGSYNAADGSTFSGAAVTFQPAATVSALGAVLNVSSGTATLNSGEAHTVSNLVLTGGTLTGTDNLTVNDVLTWRGGTLSGTGVTTTAVTSLVSLSGSGMTLGRILTNRGIALLDGPSSSLTLLTGAVLNNEGGFILSNTQGIFGAGIFNNPGAVAVDGSTTIQATFNNVAVDPGGVGVVSGRLVLSGGGNHSGPFLGVAGAALVFNGGVHDFQSTARIEGFPDVIFDAGTINFSGTYDVPANTVIRGATVTFNAGAAVTNLGTNLTVIGGTARFNSGTALATTTLLLAAGTLTGSDSLTVSDRFTWWAGTLSGTGTTTVGGAIEFSGTNMTLGRVLTSNGTATWVGAGSIFATSDGVFNNNGTFDVQNDQGFTSTSCLGTFNNAGMFQKTGGHGTTTVGLLFNNTGAVDVQTGIVNFSCGAGPGGGQARPDVGALDAVFARVRSQETPRGGGDGRDVFAASSMLIEQGKPHATVRTHQPTADALSQPSPENDPCILFTDDACFDRPWKRWRAASSPALSPRGPSTPEAIPFPWQWESSTATACPTSPWPTRAVTT